MKAVIYARVSSREQEETGYSLPAQEKLLKEYAQKKDCVVARIFSISESASGKYQRETFNKMMEYVKKNNIKIVICEKVDRLTRNFKDAVLIDEWLEEDEERQVHLVKDSLVLHRDSRSQEKLNWGIRILFAKNYIDNLSEEVRKGQKEKIAQGWIPMRAKLGYKTIGEKGHKIHVIDEEKAPFARKMFDLYATGNYSLKKLTATLYEVGLRNSGGHRIYKSRIAELLSDPFYYGMNRWNDQITKGEHEPLITKELFDRVQQIMKRGEAPRYRKHFPLFKALVRCAGCQGSVTWETQRGHWYGHCNGYRNCTKRRFIRQEIVEEQLLPSFDKITIRSGLLVEWIKKALKESHGEEIEYRKQTLGEIERRIKLLETKQHVLYNDRLEGRITPEFYDQEAKEIPQEKEALLNTLQRHENAQGKYFELGVNILDLAHRAKEIYLNEKRTTEQRRTLLNLIFSNLQLNEDKLSVSYTPAFRMLADYAPAWNEKFEQAKMGLNKAKSATFDDGFRPLLPR